MLFILIRLAPFFIPVLYFWLVKFMFYQTGFLFWFFLGLFLIDLLYFWLIFFKTKKPEVWLWFLHSLILMLVGSAYVLILSSNLFINLFLVIWSLIYFIYLESIFHYFYETKKALLMDLRDITAYVNLIIFFFLITFLINIYIFLDWRAWLIILLAIPPTFLLLASQFKANQIASSKILLYASILTLVLIETLLAVLFLSVSFYVSAVIVLLLYYLLVSLAILKIKDQLTKGLISQYLIFAVIVIIIMALTSQWF